MGNIIKCITCGFEHDDSDPGCVICEPDKFPGPTAEDMLACELGAHRFFAGISRDGYAKEISGRILTAFRELRDERDALREEGIRLRAVLRNALAILRGDVPERDPICKDVLSLAANLSKESRP
ncbi:MAG TPA: hypothetical protein VFI02_18015 [Armatimonadota bacterium]|nr:hypothetical protein [Armatimonadota bacterium]